MKTAFFLVLLANLTLLMYEHHRGAYEQVAETPAPDAAMLQEKIVLVSEQKSEPPAAARTTLAATVPNQSNLQKIAATPEAAMQSPVQQNTFACFEAGPFANEQIVKAWSKAVGEVDGNMKLVIRNAQEVADYLVLFPAADSPEDMKSVMQALRDKGISDAYPLATGQYKGYISLGMFRREAQAARMQEDLQGRGVEAVVKPRFKDAGQKYAFFTGPGAVAVRLGELGQKYPKILLRALRDTDPSCLESRPGQSTRPVTEIVESAAKETSLSQQKMPDSETPSGSVVSIENAPLKADVPAIRKTPAEAEQKQQNDTEDANAVNLVCYEAGPFPNEQSLSVWQKQVAGAQGRMKPVFREGKVISDYLVLYHSPGGEEATKDAMHMLRERGLGEVWPLSAGEQKGQISLGVFNREENALQMQKSLLDKGVDSVVSPRYKNKRQKYALIAGAEAIAGSLRALEKSYPDIKLHKMPDSEQNCPKDTAVMP